VRALLGPERLAHATDTRRTANAKCAVCQTLIGDAPLAIVAFASETTTRLVATHVRCHKSVVIQAPGENLFPTEAPSIYLSSLFDPQGRPRVTIVLDSVALVMVTSGPDATDSMTRLLLQEGWTLMGTGGTQGGFPTGWLVQLDGDRAVILGSTAPALYDGDGPSEPARWAAVADGALRVVHGTGLGTRDGDVIDAVNRAAKEGRVVTAVLPVRGAAERPARAGRNEPCPCGSGRKFKHCHGS